MLPTLNINAQSIKADSVKIFYIVNSDTIENIPLINTLTGKFEKKRRQFFSLKKTEMRAEYDSISKKMSVRIDTFYKQHIDDYPLIKGYYTNGLRSGRWEFIHDYGSNYSFCYSLYHDYYLTFKKDSIIQEMYFIRMKIRKAINKDSSLIAGYIEYKDNKKYNFECIKSKDRCLYWNKSKNKTEKTKLDELDGTLIKLENEENNRPFK